MSEQSTPPALAQDATQAPVASAAPAVAVPFRAPPALWARRKRPVDGPTHADTQKQLVFDAFFAGARSLGKWEEEWPLMTESEFDAAMQAASSIELGGQNPDGTHPRAPKAER